MKIVRIQSWDSTNRFAGNLVPNRILTKNFCPEFGYPNLFDYQIMPKQPVSPPPSSPPAGLSWYP